MKSVGKDMVDKQTIGINALITLGIVLASAIGTNYFDNPKYYCASESSIMECPGELSGGTQTRCYLNSEKSSWDYCRGGWVEVDNDLQIQEEPEPTPLPTVIDPYAGIKPVTGTQWRCDPKTCERLR